MNIPLMCRIFGHKWREERAPTLKELKSLGLPPTAKYRVVISAELTHCLRCGIFNPAYEEWKKTHEGD